MSAKRASNIGLPGLQSWRTIAGPAAVGNASDLAGAPYRGVMVDTDGNYQFVFDGDGTNTPCPPLPLKAGVQYGFVIRRVTAAAGNVFGGGS